MKTHQLILLTTALFTTLFYGENLGLNLAILSVAYALLTLCNTSERNRTQLFLLLFVLTITSGGAFAWYGDLPSFLAVFTSGFLLSFQSKNRGLKSILVIPVFALNFCTFFYRFFQFSQWLPKNSFSGPVQRLLSVFVVPTFLILIFFFIYASGSTHFSSLFTEYEFDFNLWEFFVLSTLGFFIAFNFWNFKVYEFIFASNHHLKNDFLNEDKIQRRTNSFLDLGSERKSGVVSLIALNILLLIFIVTFNYEQFIEIPKTPVQLSAETHERVNAVILSIIMAICVILFYFKGSLNFDKKASVLQLLAKIWILLNSVLVISAFVKNAEYVINLGLTYKRLGVIAFLILCIIGLMLTLIKIQKQKTNAFLYNNMIWFFYGIILVCSYINWGGMATHYNIVNKKGDYPFLQTLNFNDKALKENFPKEYGRRQIQNAKNTDLENKETFLSKILYYETLSSK